MKVKNAKRGAAAISGIVIGILNAVVLIFLICLADYYFLKLIIFSSSSTLILVFLILSLIIFIVLGKIARSLRERSEGADKIAFEGLGHAAAIMDPTPIPADETQVNPFIIRVVMSVLFILIIAVIAGTAYYFSSDKWKAFLLSYGIIVIIEWLMYYWINPLNRIINNRIGLGGLS